jgi:hypothetical protein
VADARKDRVSIQVLDDDIDSGGLYKAQLVYESGTPGSGSYPAVPDNALSLALIDVPALGGGDPAVTDDRDRTSCAGGFLWVPTTTKRDTLTASTDTDNPLLVYVKATGLLYLGDDGATWEALATQAYVDAAVAAIDLDATLDTYTPTLTASSSNPNLGSGGDFLQSGAYAVDPAGWCDGYARLRFGSTGMNPGSGLYNILLPLPADLTFHYVGTVGTSDSIGEGMIRDNDAASTNSQPVIPYLYDGTHVALMSARGYAVQHNTPFGANWAPGDAINIHFRYRPA